MIKLSQLEENILRKNYHKDGPQVLARLLGKNHKTIAVLASRRGLKAPFNRKSVSVPRISLETRALIIEDFICLQMTCKDLSVKYSISYTTISSIVNKYFKYMGPNKEVLILKSKV